MALIYLYQKVREDFGRQPRFSIVPRHIIDSIPSNVAEQKKYCLRNPVHRETQACPPKSEKSANTTTFEYAPRGINHSEGGWPKDISINDEESVTRYRRRFERDDDYVDAVLTLAPKFEHLIKQNNALDVYEHYFKGMKNVEPAEKPVVKFLNIFEYPVEEQKNLPIASIGWTSEDDSKLVVAYCDKTFPLGEPVNTNLTGLVWNVEDPHKPVYEFLPPSACWQIACSPSSPYIIISGLENGTVCIFDFRVDKSPVVTSETHLAHRDPVTALKYLHSRSNNEFFSGSTDGRCLWYDIRNISKPIDSLVMTLNVQSGQALTMAEAEPVSVLQYDRSFPSRFYCGTDTGLVINVNRKAKSHNDMMSTVYKAHKGPVKAIHRSPCTSKMFITCGDWTVHIWSDDVLSSPIITGTSQRYQINDVIWAPHRVSSYMSVGGDGKFRYWDLLRKVREPVSVLRLAKCPLLEIKCHEEGRLVAVGDKEGALHLISLSESMVISGDKDKQIMYQMYERETRREHLLELRVKEIRSKAAEQEKGTDTRDMVDDESQIAAAEIEYRRVVLEEIRSIGAPSAVTRTFKHRR